MFKCICLILRSRLTVTISSGNNISLHDICIVFSQMMLASLLISCFASCQHSVVVVSVSVYVSPSHVTCIHFYICITISSHNHTAAAAGHGKHSYLCQDTWDAIHQTGSQKALLHCICTTSGIHAQVIFTFCYVHFTELSQGTIMCSRLSAQSAASAPCCDYTKPLTITSHRAPLVHNSCTSHPSYLHACNNWGE